MLLLLSAAVLHLFVAAPAAGPRDTSSIFSKITPTINRAPVVGVRSVVIADSLVVEKAKRTLTLFSGGLPVRTYKVALGLQPTGDKIKKGDNRTPEGTFFIDFKNAQSKYYKALHISYPDIAHAQRASALGFSPGGDIMIHGLPPRYASYGADHTQWDWTEGCIAVTDKEIDEIFSAVPTGAPIHIKP
jgi:murein L,D-transpeptidase YafK